MTLNDNIVIPQGGCERKHRFKGTSLHLRFTLSFRVCCHGLSFMQTESWGRVARCLVLQRWLTCARHFATDERSPDWAVDRRDNHWGGFPSRAQRAKRELANTPCLVFSSPFFQVSVASAAQVFVRWGAFTRTAPFLDFCSGSA